MLRPPDPPNVSQRTAGLSPNAHPSSKPGKSTGAQKSLLGESAVQRLRSATRDPTRSLMGLVAVRRHRMPASTASIGTVALTGDRLQVNSFGGNQPFDDVLGLDILRDYDLDIDGPNRVLTLYYSPPLLAG